VFTKLSVVQRIFRDSCRYMGADKSLARPGRKQATATEDSQSSIYPIYNHNWRNISTVYIYNKTSIKRNIVTIKQNASGSRSGEGLISIPVHKDLLPDTSPIHRYPVNTDPIRNR
jgi:hypothetical protein